MADWTEGYVANVDYTYGYYAELNPLRIQLAFLNAGYAFPQVGAACELGFGQGVSVNMHAAASVTRWQGTDFNPSHVSFARDLAAGSGAEAALYDEAFDAFCSRPDLPDFDYIGLHGIWSWISDKNRRVIVDFIRRKLKVGGVLYISYNTQPGWAAMAPVRDLLAEHAGLMGTEGGGIVPQIDASLDFVQRVLGTDSAFARANPAIGKRLEQLKSHDRQYLAHEYFNRDWLPMSFSHMKKWLDDAKLSYACSAHYPDHVDTINLSAPQQQLLAEIPDRMFRETVRDFFVNQQFRRDYWVRGARRLPALDQAEQLRAQRLVMVAERDKVEMKIVGAAGEAVLSREIYDPILDLMSDRRVYTIGEIQQASRQPLGSVIQAAMLLVGKGALVPAQDPALAKQAANAALKLNRRLLGYARARNVVTALASPVTGGGVPVTRFEQLFLLARESGLVEPQDWARHVLDIFQMQGQAVAKEGKALATPEEQLDELVTQARAFQQGKLPVLRALGVCR